MTDVAALKSIRTLDDLIRDMGGPSPIKKLSLADAIMKAERRENIASALANIDWKAMRGTCKTYEPVQRPEPLSATHVPEDRFPAVLSKPQPKSEPSNRRPSPRLRFSFTDLLISNFTFGVATLTALFLSRL